MPEEYESLIREDQYQQLLKMAVAYLNRKGKVIQIIPGMVVVDLGEQQEVQCGLDNLVRVIAKQEEDDWFEIIGRHFDRVKAHFHQKPLHMDWETARRYLKTRVYPETFGKPEIRAQMVQRVDFEGTFTNLILDYEGRFHLLTKRMVEPWKQSEDKLFAIAQANINAEEIQLNQGEVEDGASLYCFFSGDFSASYIVDFQTNADFCLGAYGSLVAIPTKGAVLCMPLEDKYVLERVQYLSPLVNEFYLKDPGHITNSFYWYHNGAFHRFRYQEEGEEKIVIRLPRALEELLKN